MMLSQFQRRILVAISLLCAAISCAGCSTTLLSDSIDPLYSWDVQYALACEYAENQQYQEAALSLLTATKLDSVQSALPSLALKEQHPILGAPTEQEILMALSGLWINCEAEEPLLLTIFSNPDGLYYTAKGWILSDDLATYDVSTFQQLDYGGYCFDLIQDGNTFAQYIQLDAQNQVLSVGESQSSLVSYELLDTNASNGFRSLLQEVNS